MKILAVIFAAASVAVATGACGLDIPKYKDPDCPIEERVSDLLSRMTLEEKAAQMMSVNTELKNRIKVNSDGTFDVSAVKEVVPLGIGHVTRLSETKGGVSQTSSSSLPGLRPGEHARLSNELQRYFIEETRLGIPAIFHEEALHGLVTSYAASYPSPIALASSFNDSLMTEIFSAVAAEARTRGVHQVLSPVIDILREPRWGRVEETMGEDPYLVSRLGTAIVKAMQGDNSYSDGFHVATTLKHYVGGGEPEDGTNTAPVNVSERVLREVHLHPFREVIKNASPEAVMPTYHEVDGVPMHANKTLLRDMLRGEMGFKGMVVADYYAITEMSGRPGIVSHSVAETKKDAAALAVRAGVNIELPEADSYKEIVSLVKEGVLRESEIDEMVAEILRLKFRLGLFDRPYVDEALADSIAFLPSTKTLALKAAQQSIVLLKNNGILPLDVKSLRSVAVIGPNADRTLLGGYSGTPMYFSTVKNAVEEYCGDDVQVNYAQGCRITMGEGWTVDNVEFPDPEEEKKLIAEAVRTARKSDVVLLCLGTNEQVTREAWSLTHLGDRSSLDLIGAQQDLFDAVKATGKPVVVLLMNGTPLSIVDIDRNADAVCECWYLGQETGNAIASVVFGDYNPGGKLPITFSRSAGMLPCYYNHKPASRRGYIDGDITPLYPFGYGLSYTRFEISGISLSKSEIGAGESTEVSVKVRNTGKMAGEEVVQLYIRDEYSSVTRPVKELKGFRRIRLEAGEEKIVKFTVSPEHLAFYDINMDYVVEPGSFRIMVGNSSADTNMLETVLVVR